MFIVSIGKELKDYIFGRKNDLELFSGNI